MSISPRLEPVPPRPRFAPEAVRDCDAALSCDMVASLMSFSRGEAILKLDTGGLIIDTPEQFMGHIYCTRAEANERMHNHSEAARNYKLAYECSNDEDLKSTASVSYQNINGESLH